MRAMVFAAGLGSRLRPLTEHLPKPAIPFFGRPMASYALRRLHAFGIQIVAVNVHHLADECVAALREAVPEGMQVSFIRESSLLGTGGGLRNGMQQLNAKHGPMDEDAPFFVMNGDILFWPDLENALRIHQHKKAIATMVLRPDTNAQKHGAVELNEQGIVRRLVGKPEHPQESLRPYMFTGVHVFRAAAIEALPYQGCIVRTAYREWVDGRACVAGVVDESPWYDLGTHRRYWSAHIDAVQGRIAWPSGAQFLASTSPVHARSTIHPDAILEDVCLGEGSVIGPVSLRRCVVWPGTRVNTDETDAILTPHHRIPIEDA